MKYFHSTILFLLAVTVLTAQTRLYVNHAATGANDGSSWADALTELQSALAAAQSGDEVWVAQGTYLPTQTSDRSISFEPRSGVRLYGGFAGHETDPSQRDWDAHPTILSGDIGTLGDSTDNSYNVMAFGEAEEGTLLDGLTFRGGHAEPIFVFNPFQRDGCGGGLHVSAGDGVAYLVLRNCRFERNYARLKGGAVFVHAGQDGSVAPQFLNCAFEGNSGYDGAAVYYHGTVDVERVPDFGACSFSENRVLASSNAVLRYRGPATDDTLHIWGCRFERHVGKLYRLNWLHAVNHARFDGCSFIENEMTVFSDVGGWLQSLYVTRSEFLRGRGLSLYSDDSRIAGCVFKHNGLSLSAQWVKAEISDCLLDSNTVGVVLIETSSLCEDCKVSNLTISNNQGTGASGVSLFRANGGRVRYSNVHVVNNDSLNIFNANINGDSLTFTNFSFVGNRFVRRPDLQTVPARYQNTIFYGNEYLTPDYFSVFEGLKFEHCSIDLPDCSALPPNVSCGPGNLFNLDPLFRDPAGGDYSLLPCSPLINAGSNAAALGILTDIAGNPRILEGIVDIGAYEAPAFALSAAPQVSPACTYTSNGSVSIAPDHGCEPLSYAWSPNAGNGPDLNGLPPGNFVFTITDGSGRQITDTVTVPEAPVPALSLAAQDIACGTTVGGTLTTSVSGGTAPLGYGWLPELPDQPQHTGLGPGLYALTVTDANGCQDSASASLALLGNLVLSVGGTPISCHGETDAALTAQPANGAAPFNWNWQGWPGNAPTASPLGPGLYAVTVTDAFGCTSAFMYNPVTEPAPLSLTVDSSPQTQSAPPNGAAVVTTSSGGTQPYGYLWDMGQMGHALGGLTAGTYTVTMMDARGCTATAEVLVELLVSTPPSPQGEGLGVGPNPATNWVQAILPESQSRQSGYGGQAGAWQLVLSDASGRAVRSLDCAGSDCVLDLIGLASGPYVLVARSGARVFVGRVLKQ